MVGTGAAEEHVVAGAAEQPVVAAAAGDRVGAAEAADDVGLLRAVSTSAWIVPRIVQASFRRSGCQSGTIWYV